MIEPFGSIRGDLQAAQICQVLANINRDPKSQPYEMTDFILRVPQPGDKTAAETFQQTNEARTKAMVAFQVEMAQALAAQREAK